MFGIRLTHNGSSLNERRDIVRFKCKSFLKIIKSFFEIRASKMKNAKIVFDMLSLFDLIYCLDNLDSFLNKTLLFKNASGYQKSLQRIRFLLENVVSQF